MKKVKLHISTYNALVASIDIEKNAHVINDLSKDEKQNYAQDLFGIIDKQLKKIKK